MTKPISLKALTEGSKARKKKASSKKKVAKKKVAGKKRVKKKVVKDVAAKAERKDTSTGKKYDVTRPTKEGMRILAHDFAVNMVSCGLNRTEAYRRTFDCKGLSRAAILERAKRLLADEEVQEMILAVMNDFLGQAADLRETVQKELVHQMYANVLDLFDDEGELLEVKELKKLPLWYQRCIKEVQVVTTEYERKDGSPYVVKKTYARLLDKHKSAELLAKMEGWLSANDASGNPAVLLADLIATAGVALGKANIPAIPKPKLIEGTRDGG